MHLMPPALTGGSRRHEWDEQFCTLAGLWLRGKDAAAILADPVSVNDGGSGLPRTGLVSVVAAPAFAWMHAAPSVAVGKKDRDPKGGRLTLPCRVEWSTGLVAVLPAGSTTKAAWTGSGVGCRFAGSLTVHSDTDLYCEEPDEAPFVGPGGDADTLDVLRMAAMIASAATPGPFWLALADETGAPVHDTVVHAMYAREARDVLRAMVSLGEQAWWELLARCEALCWDLIDRVHFSVAMDVTFDASERILYRTSLEQIVRTTVYGDGEQPGATSQVWRLLTRLTAPGGVDNYDPQFEIVRKLRRDLMVTMYRHLDDPDKGRLVRQVARDIGCRDADEVLAAYRAKYPGSMAPNSSQQLSLDGVKRSLRPVYEDALSYSRAWESNGPEDNSGWGSARAA